MRLRRLPRAAARVRRGVSRSDDRLRDALDRLVAETGSAEQLLGTLLRTADDRGGLTTRPLERLFDLGAGRVRELGRLVSCLLQQPRRARLGLGDLLRGLLLRLLGRLPRLALGGVQQLGPLALALLPITVDLALADRKSTRLNSSHMSISY